MPDKPTDKELLDWLNEQAVDVIYLDNGRIIDVRGDDIRRALAIAIKTGAALIR